jgi:high affinity sulfate transporter 1
LTIVPAWLRGYRRAWLGRDLVAGLIVWSVVVPQAVAYAQIAGLPPVAGLMAAPGALVAYAILGTSRTLVVSATTATSAISAAAVGPLAAGDTMRYATLSAGLALLSAAVLAAAGFLRLGGVMDLVSKPVMTGFLFGLGLTIAVTQLTKVFGVPEGDGNFFELLADLIGDLDETQWWTLAVGLSSIAGLVVLGRLAPKLPATLIVLVVAIAVSALLDLSERGVEVIGELPSGLPDPSWPGLSGADVVDLLAAAFGVLIVSAEAVGVARAVAGTHGELTNPNRDLVALGASNLLAGLSQGFVQSGGASQTMANERAGGRTQLASIVAAGLVVLTGAFLAFLFEDLPQATLGAIVVVAVSGFFRVDELRRFARLRTSAVVLASIALVGVLVFGVLPGLLVAAGLSLVLVVQKLSRPTVGVLAREPATGVWGMVERHPTWQPVPGVLVVRVEGPLFYGNATAVKERLLEQARQGKPQPASVVLELAESPDLDVATLDILAELADALERDGIELRLASVRARALEELRRAGLAERLRIEPMIDAAVGERP